LKFFGRAIVSDLGICWKLIEHRISDWDDCEGTAVLSSSTDWPDMLATLAALRAKVMG
jgi:hypothetical protein